MMSRDDAQPMVWYRNGNPERLSSELGNPARFIGDELLQREAISLLRVAFKPSDLCGDHTHGDLAPDCEYELFFVRDDDA